MSKVVREAGNFVTREDGTGVELREAEDPATARVTRESFEVLSQKTGGTARVTRESFETLSQNPAPTARVTRMGLEVLQSVNELIPVGGGTTGSGWWGFGQGW